MENQGESIVGGNILFTIPHQFVGKTILCAVSGGADSMLLLDELERQKEEFQLELIVAHVNHGIRADEAKRDEEFVQSFCKQRNLHCETKRIDLPAIAKEQKLSLEHAGRIQRQQFFREMAKMHHANAVALGHHQDDQIETVFFHLARGTGLQGMQGMKVLADIWWRPMLHLPKQQILQEVKQRDIPFVQDSTNLQPIYTRNRIRAILNDFEDVHPCFKENVSRSIELFSQDHEYLMHIAREKQDEITKKSGIIVSKLLLIDRAIASRIIMLAIEKKNIQHQNMTRAHIDYLFDWLKRGNNGQITIANRIVALNQFGYLGFLSFSENNVVIRSQKFCLPKTGELQTQWGNFTLTTTNQENAKWDVFHFAIPDSLFDDLEIRNRQTGDQIVYIDVGTKQAHHKTVKKFYIDQKITRELRNGPVIARRNCGHIIWIPGVNYRFERENSKDYIQLRFEPNPAWQSIIEKQTPRINLSNCNMKNER